MEAQSPEQIDDADSMCPHGHKWMMICLLLLNRGWGGSRLRM